MNGNGNDDDGDGALVRHCRLAPCLLSALLAVIVKCFGNKSDTKEVIYFFFLLPFCFFLFLFLFRGFYRHRVSFRIHWPDTVVGLLTIHFEAARELIVRISMFCRFMRKEIECGK